ncbi:MAG: argininosuccinate lyase, partial [Betaproteobacteria bacterium]|nr:argininosuccinate lyase [Betaproteobacteria bacterium]
MSAKDKTAPAAAPGSASKPWSGRFSEPVDDLVKRFTASVGFDHRLAEFDIQ